MKKILAFGTSLNSKSTNHHLAAFAASLVNDAQVDVVKLKDFYPLEIFSVDHNSEHGVPANAVKFHELMSGYDGFIVAMAEHNGTYTAAFKNMLDWTSIQEDNTFFNKPVLIVATSPGPMGGRFVLAAAENRFTWNGASEVTGVFSLPSYRDNFDLEKGIVHDEKLVELKEKLADLVAKI